jgi:hypothetical protein
MTVSTGGSTAFNYLVSIGAVTGLINWAVVLFAYLRLFVFFPFLPPSPLPASFRDERRADDAIDDSYAALKKQGIDRREFPFQAPLQPYLSYFGFVMVVRPPTPPLPSHCRTNISLLPPTVPHYPLLRLPCLPRAQLVNRFVFTSLFLATPSLY